MTAVADPANDAAPQGHEIVDLGAEGASNAAAVARFGLAAVGLSDLMDHGG